MFPNRSNFIFTLPQLLIAYFFILPFSFVDAQQELSNSSTPEPEMIDNNLPKLLVLVLDGFRWDYYERHKGRLHGFREFLSDGVQAEYVEPIFPSLSYPSWTTIVTGLYPSFHNIIGNYMLHLANDDYPEAVFQLKDNSTKSPFWWQGAEPLWITAAKAGYKTYMGNFGNCEVPYQNITPTECTGYKYQDFNFKLREHLNKAIVRFRQGYSLAMIYDDSIDHAGHVGGPDSNQVTLTLSYIDTVLHDFQSNLKYYGLEDKLNVVITSDHGMTSIKNGSGVEFVKLDNYISSTDLVYKVIDYGPVVSIAASSGKVEMLYNDLIQMPGVNVYKKHDIPEEFHFKESKFAHDLLLLAKQGYFIVGLSGDKQIPNDPKSSSVQPYAGCHGYHNMTDMRTIFYAKGPAFKKGVIVSKISLVDEYQIFTKVLEMRSCQNNGTWDNVSDMFEF